MTGEASNTVEEWMEGKNVDPIRKPIDQINTSENTTTMSFSNEAGKGEDKSDLANENKALKEEIKELRAKLDSMVNLNEELKLKEADHLAKLDGLLAENKSLTEKIASLEKTDA